LVDGLVAVLANRLVDCLVDCLADCLVGCFVDVFLEDEDKDEEAEDFFAVVFLDDDLEAEDFLDWEEEDDLDSALEALVDLVLLLEVLDEPLVLLLALDLGVDLVVLLAEDFVEAARPFLEGSREAALRDGAELFERLEEAERLLSSFESAVFRFIAEGQ